MYCTFYRPNQFNTNEFENIIGKLAYDLHLLETQNHDEWNVYYYFYTLSCHSEPLATNSAMRFFGMAAPESMQSNDRVDFFYRPTYIATAFMMKAVLKYPSLLDEDTFLGSDLDFTVDTVKQTLKACMLACTGRCFNGAGVFRIKDCIDLFRNAGADEFFEKYPEICPEFEKLYRGKEAFLNSGEVDPNEVWFYCDN